MAHMVVAQFLGLALDGQRQAFSVHGRLKGQGNLHRSKYTYNLSHTRILDFPIEPICSVSMTTKVSKP